MRMSRVDKDSSWLAARCNIYKARQRVPKIQWNIYSSKTHDGKHVTGPVNGRILENEDSRGLANTNLL